MLENKCSVAREVMDGQLTRSRGDKSILNELHDWHGIASIRRYTGLIGMVHRHLTSESMFLATASQFEACSCTLAMDDL